MYRINVSVVGTGQESGNVLKSRQIMQRIRATIEEIFSSNLAQAEFKIEDQKVSDEEAWFTIHLKTTKKV